MELIRGIHNLRKKHKGCVATIGTFDGVHLGHLEILNQLKEKAAALGLPSLVVTFEPQTNEYFFPERQVPRLMRLREKLAAFAKSGIDRVLCAHFNDDLALLSADVFIKRVLVDGLGVQHVLVGDDFSFGRGKKGDFHLLQNLGQKYGFKTDHLPTVKIDDERVSSTRIREALERGDLETAKRLLGVPFTMSGRVAHGRKQGRILGFPTANIYLHRRAVPVSGIYVVRVDGLGPKRINGVADVGNRPTVGDSERSLLEVHLLNFHQNIYGRHVSVEFLCKLRDEEKYESMELLRQQIARDVVNARGYFSQHRGEG